MNTIVGLIMVLGACASGFVLAGGNLLALWQPFELLIIGGAAIGGDPAVADTEGFLGALERARG